MAEKRISVGILAHVDAGKTTFSEQVLYHAHAIRSAGRVDYQSAFLDTHPIERERGITVFSGQASFDYGGRRIYWIDTPGHADFSSEMERAVSLMDYAVLIVSSVDGVQSHTETVWQILKSYGVPVFVFLNKTDRVGADPDRVLRELKTRLGGNFPDVRAYQETGAVDEDLREEIAGLDEQLMEAYFAGEYEEDRWLDSFAGLIRGREAFPVMSGAALDGTGIDGFLKVFTRLTDTSYEACLAESLSARVWQIRHDDKKQRLCFLKLLTGRLSVKDEIALPEGPAKVNELRVYHGAKYLPVNEAFAGDVVCVPGLDGLKAGDTVGGAPKLTVLTEPMMESEVLFDGKAVPAFRMMEALRILEDEEPALGADETMGRISVRVMGRIQLEVLKNLIAQRFGIDVTFGPCRVLYKETVAEPCIGIGHYEPLRHYAEVHLRLLPGKRGSGIRFRSLTHVDTLSLNWQRLIETHVFEKQHKGILTGAPLTDVTVELLWGRDHLKHTEGGDFRQAVYRAIRNALMHDRGVLLEPVCAFQVTVPGDLFSTINGSLIALQANIEPPEFIGENVLLRGEAPYSVFSSWQDDFMMKTHGRGALRVRMARYDVCHDADAVIAEKNYNPLADDTPDSVFCQKGAGFTVAWNKVADFAHGPKADEYAPPLSNG